MTLSAKKTLLYSIFILNLAVVIWFWWQTSGSLFGIGLPAICIALGRIAGLLAVTFVLLQFVFVGRNPWIEQVFGLDRLTRIHHWNGFLALSFILLHPTLIITGYMLGNKATLLAQIMDFILNYEDVWQAALAVCLFVGIVLFSVTIVRKKFRYETWYFVHLGMYLAILFAWGHQLKVGDDFLHSQFFSLYWYALYILVFGSLLSFRFARPLVLFARHRFFVSRIEQETASTTSIYISGRHMPRYRIVPGQFMILRFLSRRYIFQAHPFSLSWMPHHNELRITVKAVGDFTRALRDIAVGTSVVVDGPYGIFTKRLAHHKKFLFLAGGIGITPIRAILESLPEKTDAILLYGNRAKDDVPLKRELDALGQSHHFPIHYLMSHDTTWNGRRGIITPSLIEELVPDFRDRSIYLCGPKPMMLHLKNELVARGVHLGDIHFELFSLQ